MKRLLALSVLASLIPVGTTRAAVIEVDPTAVAGAETVRTLPEALDRLRTIRSQNPNEAITIELASGVHRVERPVVLTIAESGGPDSPTVIRGAPDGSSVIRGSVAANSRPFTPQDAADSKVDSAGLVGRARVIELSDYRLPGPRVLAARGAYVGHPASTFELVQDGRRLHPSRWPNEGYWDEATASMASGGGSMDVRIPDDKASAWSREPNLWLAGYWAADWAYETLRVTNARPQEQRLRVPRLNGPVDLREGPFRIAALNALSELDEPGEYHLDSRAGRVVFLPIKESAPAELAVAETAVILQGVHHALIENVVIENTRGEALRISGGSDIVVRECGIRNTGSRGILVEGASRTTVERCVVADTAETGIAVYAGDRPSLTPGAVTVKDSIVVRFGQDNPTYRPGVELQGVGNAVTGSYIAEGPHVAVHLGGNDHRVEANEIEDVLRETNDAGAIYMGRDWTTRGNVVTGNYLHDIAWKAPTEAFLLGVYLDDQFSGVTVSRNVFHRVHRPVIIGGGRDNVVSENLFLHARKPALLFDDRGLNWQVDMAGPGGDLRQKLDAMPYQSDLWRQRYPALPDLLKREPGAPVGNRFVANVAIGADLIELTPGDFRHRLVEDGNAQYAAGPAEDPSPQDAATLRRMLATDERVAGLKLALADRKSALADLLHADLALPPPVAD